MIIWKDCVDSTNDEMRRLSQSLGNHSVLAARMQTSGRGQGDHLWHSSPGLNLTFTLLHRPVSLAASDIGSINHAVCLGLVAYLEGKGVGAAVKWPNDIWVGDRKICGLLIENILESNSVRECLIGVGFNLNQTVWPSGLPNPVSLKELLPGRDFRPEEELVTMKNEICRRLDRIDNACDRISLQEEFGKYVFRLPKEV